MSRQELIEEIKKTQEKVERSLKNSRLTKIIAKKEINKHFEKLHEETGELFNSLLEEVSRNPEILDEDLKKTFEDALKKFLICGLEILALEEKEEEEETSIYFIKIKKK